MNSNDEPRIVYIPENYKTGTSFMGFEIKIFNLIQAAILFMIPFFIAYVVLPSYIDMNLTSTYLFSFTLFFAAGLGYFGLIGVNNMTLGEFIYHFLVYKKRQRKAYYNPRVKREILNILVEEETREELPREKIIALYNSYKTKMEEKNRETAVKNEKDNGFNTQNMYFEDDYGIVEKPVEYMSAKEYKEFRKQEKKKKKQEEKQRRLAEKEKRREDALMAKADKIAKEVAKERKE